MTSFHSGDASRSPIDTIDLATPLGLRSSFLFPMQNPLARKEIVIGGLFLFVPFVGWLLNMGHRIQMVHNMMNGKSAWPAWTGYMLLFRHGLTTFAGMVLYYLPAAVFAIAYVLTKHVALLVPAGVFALIATIAIPGYMSHYCRALDPREIFNPVRAFSRVAEAGRGYWHAWAIALSALLCSLAGLLAFGIGFLFTSVWFWQVAGFSFASVMTQQHALQMSSRDA